MENFIMVLDETMNTPNAGFEVTALPQAAMEPQLAPMPLWNDYSRESGRQDEGLPFLLFGEEDGDEEEDMEEDEGFDDMDDDFDDDCDDDEEDFEEEDYEDEDEDYDYEEDVDYDDFDE
jgi:hypothetical protein